MSGPAPDWELDYFSRPLLDGEGRRVWEVLICSSGSTGGAPFRWSRTCASGSVNSVWLQQALHDALEAQRAHDGSQPRRLRCWRTSMRTLVQRAAAPLDLEVIPSRRCYALVEWLQQREREVYPSMEGYMAGPLAPAPSAPPAPPRPLPEAVRGEGWSWAQLPGEALLDAGEWPMDFGGLVPLPPLEPGVWIPGVRLFSPQRALALAGWLAGLEPVRLELRQQQLVLEAGLDDRWLVSDVPADQLDDAQAALTRSRELAGGLQFVAVQSDANSQHFTGFWLLRDLPDP